MPPPKFPIIPRPLFVDVDRSLNLERPSPIFINKKKFKIYKRPIAAQRTNSADDFRTPLPKYVPRPLFVDVTAPLGPRPNLSGHNSVPGQKNRSTTNGKLVQSQATAPARPVQNQPAVNSTTQVRLGSAISLTPSNNSKTNPPPAHSQKPSISIIPQPASTRAGSNIATPKPPPFVPKSTSMVQNPLNLTKNIQKINYNQNKNVHNVQNKNQPSKFTEMLQKAEDQIRNIVGNDLMKSKNTATSQTNKSSHKIITPPPPRRVIATAPPPALNKILVPPPVSRPLVPHSVATPTSDPLYVPVTTSWSASSTTTSTTSTTTTASNQQSPLQKRMRNFMEHLHQLQQSMKDKNGDGGSNLGDSNFGRVWNPIGKTQGTSAKTSTVPINNTNISSMPMSSSLHGRTVVRVGPKSIAPVIGGVGTTNVTRLNAAKNLSNITKTYQKTRNNHVTGIGTTTSHSPANRPNVRVVGTLPTSVAGSNTFTPTTRVISPSNSVSNAVHTDGNSPKVIRKVITNSPNGAPRNTVINTVGQANGVHGNTVINPIVGHNNNGNIPRVITRVVGPKPISGKARVNPVGLLNGNVGSVRVVPSGGSVLPGHKKIVVTQQGDASVQNQTSPIRLDLLQKKMMTNLNKLSTKMLPPKQIPSSPQRSPRQLFSSPQRLPRQLPSAPQRSFHNGSSMKTYEARKNNPLSRANSLSSLSLSQSAASVSKSNKENRTRRKLYLQTNNNDLTSAIDLSNDEDGGNTSSGGSLSRDVVNTLKKKGVSINYLGKGNEKDVINLD